MPRPKIGSRQENSAETPLEPSYSHRQSHLLRPIPIGNPRGEDTLAAFSLEYHLFVVTTNLPSWRNGINYQQ